VSDLDAFSSDYAAARAAFLDAVRRAGGEPETITHPLAEPDGETLATDTAWFGPRDAKAVLWVSSGTHGIEGFCGSAAQIAGLRSGRFGDLPPGVAVLLVHAVNPFGFAWQRRVNEDNVDLNRNFIDHAAPYPANPIYDDLHDALCPATWDEATRAASAEVLAAAAKRHGERAALEGVSRGQYSHPDGLFFGGRGRTWSNHTVEALTRRYLSGARHVASLDMHTGLGPSGYGEPIATTDDPAVQDIMQGWYGEDLRIIGAGSVSGTVTGALSDGIAASTSARVYPVALEFGTVERHEVRLALRADTWLHHHGDPASQQGRAIKRQIRAAFYVETDAWKRAVLDRTAEIAGKALDGLAGLAEASS